MRKKAKDKTFQILFIFCLAIFVWFTIWIAMAQHDIFVLQQKVTELEDEQKTTKDQLYVNCWESVFGQRSYTNDCWESVFGQRSYTNDGAVIITSCEKQYRLISMTEVNEIFGLLFDYLDVEIIDEERKIVPKHIEKRKEDSSMNIEIIDGAQIEQENR